MRAILFSLLVACGGTPEPTQAPPEQPEAEAPEVKKEAIEAGPEGGPVEPGEPAAMRVWFEEPKEGATVTSPVEVVFGVEGMEVRPAGTMDEHTGHHHLILDSGPVEKGQAVPKDSKNIHFGKGETETTVELEPGEHTLTMQFADGNHISYGEEMAQTIKVTVTE